MIEVVPAQPVHLAPIAEFMRLSDQQEIEAASGHSPLNALNLSLRYSTLSWVGLDDGQPIGIGGVGPWHDGSGDGCPWLLGTDRILQHQREFLRISLEYLGYMQAAYNNLYNYVDCRNKASIRWLKWLGFQFESPAPRGVAGLPFMRFSRSRHV